ncbi:MAG: signal peptidase I [Planctomycetes bacterium]|nr:signal peptidase I [Planctomycetota bacterium]MBI3843189.1 signal peptidase I [Planctomycetota bacterium]
MESLDLPPPAPPEEIPPSQARSLWIRENIEAVVVAVIIALLIRNFCVEAFKIPTGSMEPTLIGQQTNGDRILVDKFIYQIRRPRRFEIVVFRYPLDRSRNFVKRLVGLPGEQIDIRDGDLYVNGSIARKPADLQAEMFANWRVWPRDEAGSLATWKSSFRRTGDGRVEESEDHRSLRVEAQGECVLRYQDTVAIASRHQLLPIGDRMIRVTVQPETLTGSAVLFLEEGGDSFRLEVSPKHWALTRNGVPIGGRSESLIRLGHRTTLALANPDDAVVVTADGDVTARVEYSPLDRDEDPGHQSIGFGAASGVATFCDVAIFRDLYYTPEGETSVHVPDDALFVLGDNSPQSKDSRHWIGREVILDDGRTIFADADARTDPTLGMLGRFSNTSAEYVDEFGEPFEPGKGGARYGPRESRPFVPMSLLMGKAFLVFWPPVRRDDERSAWRLNLKFVR